jgi:hypothetical protein
MKIQIACPVCGADHIAPINRQSLMKSNGENKGGTDAVAFRCGRGHVFVVNEAEQGNHAKEREKVPPTGG